MTSTTAIIILSLIFFTVVFMTMTAYEELDLMQRAIRRVLNLRHRKHAQLTLVKARAERRRNELHGVTNERKRSA